MREWKDSGKDGDSHEEPAEKILSKVKDAKPSAKKKLLKKKNQEKEDSTFSSAESEKNERKRREKKHLEQKRKRKSPSSSSLLKRNLPSSMAEYANHFFNTYKDFQEELLKENPVLPILQQVIPLDDFITSLLLLQTFATSNH